MITDEQRAALVAAAEAEGVDVDAVIAAAEAASEDAEEGPGVEAPAVAEAKVYQYHLPFLTVAEVRRTIGMTDRVTDDDMFTGPWLARHGHGGKSDA